MKLIIVAMLLAKAHAQVTNPIEINYVASAPVTACTVAQRALGVQIVITTGATYTCIGASPGIAGTWTLISGSGGTAPTSATVVGTDGTPNFIAAPLANGKFWVGSAGNLPVAVTPSGDVSMTNAGAFTNLKLNGSTPGGACTNQFVSALSTSAVPTCSTATLAGSQFANQGTVTTLLHGNAAGNPSFSAASLTADVSGILPLANGGSGANLSATGGTSQFVKQASAGAVFTVVRPSCSDLSDAGTACTATIASYLPLAGGTMTAALKMTNGIPIYFGDSGAANGVAIYTDNGGNGLNILQLNNSTITMSTVGSGNIFLSPAGSLVISSLTTAPGLSSTGTKFTISGCAAGTTVGGGTAGTFVSGTTGACTVVITMNGATGLTAPNGWACAVSNLTTANLIRQTVSSATTCTVSGETVTGDVISFHAIGF